MLLVLTFASPRLKADSPARAGTASSASTLRQVTEAGRRPNILLVIVDDMGFSDPGCYGGEIETPHLDSLATGGLRFSQFRVTPMCVTTRVSLFAGMEYHAAGGQRFSHGVNLAHVLRDAGYTTSMSGKAHGFAPKVGDRKTDCGFDRFFGHHSGMTHFFRTGPDWFLNGERFRSDDTNFYATDAITDYSIRFIKEAVAGGRPFFSYIAYNAPHSPIQAPRELVEKYLRLATYAAGWDALRSRRFSRQQALGLFPTSLALPPKGVEVPDWSALPAKPAHPWELGREFEELCMAAYAAMIDRVDQNLGRVLACLRDPDDDGDTSDGVLDNTLIVFLSDNGAAYAGPYKSHDERPWLRDANGLHMNYGWSYLSNTPFRFYKHSSHEGALRSPLIMHWPAGVTKQRGSVLHQSCNVWDLYPTFLELAQAAYPASYGGRPVRPLMGRSLLPVLNGAAPTAAGDYFISSYSRSRGLVARDWKIVSYADSPWELYHISEDPLEQQDLRTTNPEQFSRLLNRWDAHFEKHPMVEPWALHENPQPRGFGHDRRERFHLTASSPEFMADNVSLDAGLTLNFDGTLDFSHSEGRFIRLQKYGSPEILWQADPEPTDAAQGTSRIRFDDFPRLEPGSHYYITWDAGWATIRRGSAVTTLNALRETAEAFRFRTRR